MERKAILAKVQDETNKTEKKKLVPKLVYGIDRNDNFFIYFKMKDFSITDENPSGRYEDDSFVLLYQNPKNIEDEVEQRQKEIIDWFKKEYNIGKERMFENNAHPKRHFFICGKLFNTRKKINKFYINSIRKMLTTMNDEHLLKGIIDFPDLRFLEEPGLLNFCKR